jgi:hypothetical protein
MRQEEQDSHNENSRTGRSEQVRKKTTGRMGLPEQDRVYKPEHDMQNRTGRT